MLNFGILGKNARNLLYIKKFNNKKSIRLANNKIKTKSFLSARGIPFAKNYAIIKNRKELFDMKFENLPNHEFVVKPNRGSKGKGIYIAKYLGSVDKDKSIDSNQNILNKYLSKLKKTIYCDTDKIKYFKVGGELIDESRFKRYILDNLDGKNSMTSGSDKVIIEEKLTPGTGFKDFCEHGLADIRVIVFNLVPVNAMVRMPTRKSEGKANLARGGIGLGIDLGTGRINSLFKDQKLFKKSFPKEFQDLKDKKLSYRDEILFLSSKIQYFVNLGYLALDWVITEDGPKLLEINARAGLEVQNISGVKLRNTLNKISDLKIKDPDKGVEISKTLFSPNKTKLHGEKLLYLSQYGELTIRSNDIIKDEVIVKVNINKSENYVAKNIFQLIKDNPKSDILLDLEENDVHFKNLKFLMDETLDNNKIVLGKETSSDFLIKPLYKTEDKISVKAIGNMDIYQKNKLKYIDDEISKISKKLILSKILKPNNYLEELDIFIAKDGKYNPKFEYKWPENEKLTELTEKLLEIQEYIKTIKTEERLTKIFNKKIEELFFRINLIKSYKDKNYKNILLYNEKLFGKIDKKLLDESKTRIFEGEPEDKNLLGKELDINTVKKEIEKHLIKKGISGVDIIITSTTLARMSITMGKKAKIKINRLVPFREKELRSIIAHEIDTHLVRYINGSKTGWNIFKEGVGYYLKEEEGLAIYNASKYVPKGYEKLSFYKKYFLLREAQKYNFAKLVDLVKFLYPEKRMEWVFNAILRMKKGIENTSITNEGAIFMKEKVYLDGYKKISERAENGGEVEEMYKGKIKKDNIGFI